MAQCPHCPIEYDPVPGMMFCDGCGGRLNQSVPMTDPVPVVTPAEIPEPGAGAGPDSSGNGPVKVQHVGDGPAAGRDVIIHNTVGVEFCAAGHEKLFGDRQTFLCPVCHKYPVCEVHFDRGSEKCSACAEGPKVSCALCNDRLPASQTFTCQKCLRIVGTDHRDATQKQRCTECGAEWAGIAEAIERDGVVVSKDGTVVAKDDVVTKDGKLQTINGDPVATIKENTWYARPKQWYRVKARLLGQEQQVMHRFYPSFRISSAPDGDIFWQGVVTTWAGNEYEVHLRYPDNFPYLPPKVFVMKPKIEKSRHIYPDGHLCLFHKDDRSWEPRTTAATVMSWVSLWLHCYEIWHETGNWPRPEHDDYVVTPNY